MRTVIYRFCDVRLTFYNTYANIKTCQQKMTQPTQNYLDSPYISNSTSHGAKLKATPGSASCRLTNRNKTQKSGKLDMSSVNLVMELFVANNSLLPYYRSRYQAVLSVGVSRVAFSVTSKVSKYLPRNK